MLDELLAYFENNPVVECNPYPIYSSEVYSLLGIYGFDDNYSENKEKLTCEVEEMNKKEIKTLLSFIERGERFCDGHIMSYIEDKTLLRVIKRIIELTKNTILVTTEGRINQSILSNYEHVFNANDNILKNDDFKSLLDSIKPKYIDFLGGNYRKNDFKTAIKLAKLGYTISIYKNDSIDEKIKKKLDESNISII